MTLKELIKLRMNKFDEYKQASCSIGWKEYMCGWESAYQVLEEILEQNGFDTDIVVIKGDENN